MLPGSISPPIDSVSTRPLMTTSALFQISSPRLNVSTSPLMVNVPSIVISSTMSIEPTLPLIVTLAPNSWAVSAPMLALISIGCVQTLPPV